MSLLESGQKLVVVSNRLPISVSKDEKGKLQFSSSSGGLATAMSSLDIDKESFLWIGWPGIASEELTTDDRKQIEATLEEHNFIPVYLNQKQVDNFYSGYANDTIWPLFHYFQSYANNNPKYWKAYQDVNEAYASAVITNIDVNSYVWVHDYHLMLLPQKLRILLPRLAIGFFLHIPFPSYEIIRQLPNRREILEGLMGSDLVGFHIYDYVRHFLSSCKRILSSEVKGSSIDNYGRNTTADSFPIGIDYKKFDEAANSRTVSKRAREINKIYKNQKIILSVDRLDYSKGILERLEAFELFLKEHPHQHGKVSLVVVAVPSRTDVETYQHLRDQIEQAIGRINGQYADVKWTPISYQFKNLPFDELVALYSASDIALVTPIRDGMNLVAKEFVACRTDNDGVLILSEMAGAVDELHEAIKVNPNDTRSIVKAIEDGLNMPEKQQKARIKLMKQRISEYTIQRWAEDFIEQLRAIKQTQATQYRKIMTKKDELKLYENYTQSKKRLILLDYDGTLRDFVSTQKIYDPEPSKDLRDILKKISSDPKNTVYIISGRPAETLEKWFGSYKVNLAGEHGAALKVDGKWQTKEHNFDGKRQEILNLLTKYTLRTPGAYVEDKKSSIVWHYRTVPEQLAFVRKEGLINELSRILLDTSLDICQGSKIIEIKPKTVGKDILVASTIKKLKPSLILAIGDDYTDEDMFKVIGKHNYTIKVGRDQTAANYRIRSVSHVHELLKKLI